MCCPWVWQEVLLSPPNYKGFQWINSPWHKGLQVCALHLGSGLIYQSEFQTWKFLDVWDIGLSAELGEHPDLARFMGWSLIGTVALPFMYRKWWAVLERGTNRWSPGGKHTTALCIGGPSAQHLVPEHRSLVTSQLEFLPWTSNFPYPGDCQCQCVLPVWPLKRLPSPVTGRKEVFEACTKNLSCCGRQPSLSLQVMPMKTKSSPYLQTAAAIPRLPQVMRTAVWEPRTTSSVLSFHRCRQYTEQDSSWKPWPPIRNFHGKLKVCSHQESSEHLGQEPILPHVTEDWKLPRLPQCPFQICWEYGRSVAWTSCLRLLNAVISMHHHVLFSGIFNVLFGEKSEILGWEGGGFLWSGKMAWLL